jgi:hypothetical protein
VNKVDRGIEARPEFLILFGTLNVIPASCWTFGREMASLGNRDALAQLPDGRMVTGFAAWLLWRGFYLSRLSGVSRKLRVAADWALSGLFARNVAVLPWTSERLTVAEDHAPQG